ncbi:hypothetical protein DVH24_014771 [Malus domestica]|uniref:F-box domain-containing protein n=1 Tax=Malus domestica TaxID=3750 RepID=A0A498K7T3_MALDO|nr:hypothetical protein DVH24_014771 [Malus domestica]
MRIRQYRKRPEVERSYLAQKSLDAQLQRTGVLDSSESIYMFAEDYQTFRALWAEQGDEISLEYAGNYALKGDLVRMAFGSLKFVQDAMDLIIGCYTVRRDTSTFRAESFSFLPVASALLIGGLTLTSVTLQQAGRNAQQYMSSVLLARVTAGVAAVVKVNGRQFCSRPRLCRVVIRAEVLARVPMKSLFCVPSVSKIPSLAAMHFQNKNQKQLMDLPEGCLLETLSRMPTKSLFRASCVSKTLCDLVQRPFYAAMHAQNAATTIVEEPQVVVLTHSNGLYRLITRRQWSFFLAFRQQAKSIRLQGTLTVPAPLPCKVDDEELKHEWYGMGFDPIIYYHPQDCILKSKSESEPELDRLVTQIYVLGLTRREIPSIPPCHSKSCVSAYGNVHGCLVSLLNMTCIYTKTSSFILTSETNSSSSQLAKLRR